MARFGNLELENSITFTDNASDQVITPGEIRYEGSSIVFGSALAVSGSLTVHGAIISSSAEVSVNGLNLSASLATDINNLATLSGSIQDYYNVSSSFYLVSKSNAEESDTAVSSSYATLSGSVKDYPTVSASFASLDKTGLAYTDVANIFTLDQSISGSLYTSASVFAGITGGSVTAPSIAFGNDKTTGLYQSAPGVIGFASAGVFAGRISTSEGLACTNANITNVTASVVLLSGTGSLRLPEIESGIITPVAGDIIYSGSKHYGWNGSSWNAFY